MGRILALDVGEVRVGIALSDELRIIASPHSVISRDEKTVSEILDIIGKNNVDLIVCGLPLSMDGKETQSSEKIRGFAAEIESKSGVKLVMFDERFTTVSAQRILIDGNMRRDKRKTTVDKIAAAIILEGYMRKYINNSQ